MKYVGIVGNNATTSTNRTLMQHIATRYADQAEFDVQEIRDIPAFTTVDHPEGSAAPPEAQALIDAIEGADGVIIATPEYNHSIPAPLKSALEWVSWCSTAMRGKAVMIVGASYGRLGTSRAQQHLRDILNSPRLRARVLGAEFLLGDSLQAFDDSGNLVKDTDAQALDAHFAEFTEFASVIKELHGRQGAQKTQNTTGEGL